MSLRELLEGPRDGFPHVTPLDIATVRDLDDVDATSEWLVVDEPENVLFAQALQWSDRGRRE